MTPAVGVVNLTICLWLFTKATDSQHPSPVGGTQWYLIAEVKIGISVI